MLFRLGTLRLIRVNPNHKVLSFKTLEIPKKIHHTLIKTSPFTSCSINCKSIKLDETKQKPMEKNSLIVNAFQRFRSNPYVRIMRLDRPIGKLVTYSVVDRTNLEEFKSLRHWININPQIYIYFSSKCFEETNVIISFFLRIISSILALRLVNSIECITSLFT